MKTNLKELFGADLRALALVRIGVALIILLDLLERSSDLVADYTDFGLTPRSFVIDNNSRWYVSLHFMSGVWEIQAILFIVAAIFAVALLLGYRTRLVTIISWVLLTSLSSRNPYILSGGDILLGMLLFWGIFLPWGACYSIDRAWHPSWDNRPTRCVSWGTAAYVIQILMVYWVTAILKSGPQWRSEGTAIYYSLNLDYMASSFGHFLLQFPLLLKLMTFGVFWFEVIGPLLLLCPFFGGSIRLAAICGFCLLHIGILSTLLIGFFPAVNIVAMFFFLPSGFLDNLAARLRSAASSPLKIFYDADCEFCWKSARLVMTFLLFPESVVIPAQSDPKVEDEMRTHNSWVIEEGGNRFFRYDGIPALGNASALFWPLAPVLRLSGVRWTGEKLYDFVSAHRKVACNIDSSVRTVSIPGLKLAHTTNVGIVLVLIYLLFWNLASIPASGVKIPEQFAFVAYGLRMDQNWRMFAPYPPLSRGWFVIPGKLSNSETVDLFRGGAALDWRKPPLVSSIYKNHRWRKLGESLLIIKPLPLSYALYLCRNWNSSHGTNRRLEELEIFYLSEKTLPNNEYSGTDKTSILRHRCAAQ